MKTIKPPKGLVGAPYLEQHGIDVLAVTEPTCIFEGSPRDAAVGFPANLNVAVALALAGIGPDRTELQIWADPEVTRNTHEITVDADSTRFTMRIEGVPSEANPRTGKLTPLSVLAALDGLVNPLRIGT
jgi:aspartate dehydrogenase